MTAVGEACPTFALSGIGEPPGVGSESKSEPSNLTPPPFSEAVEEGQDVPPATLLQALKIVSSGQAQVVIVNAQAGGPETQRIQQAAKDAGTPVLAFSELVPDGRTYLSWMQGNADALARALG